MWLCGAASFLFAGVVWSGSRAHAVQLSPVEEARQAAEHADDDRIAVLGRLQLAGIAARRAGPPRVAAVDRTPVPPTAEEEDLALARYVSAVGADSVESVVEQSGARLAEQVVADDRINLPGGSAADVAAGRVDPRVLALVLYLAEAHGQVTVSSLVTGHSRYVAQTRTEKKREAPRRVSGHAYGRAVDISAVGGVPVLGNQLPGGMMERVVDEILTLPEPLQPRQLISLLDLSGPSFRLPDHADHFHIGF